MRQIEYHRETFTSEEESVLLRFFTNVDKPVFVLKDLPEVVKGALFARYSRSSKSLRRLFLDEFAEASCIKASPSEELGQTRAAELFRRVFYDYGDDSVAQLGGAHLACEQASNILTKVLEWGRLGSYLEQSTRYVYFDKKSDGRYRYLTPPELLGSGLEREYIDAMDSLFDLYSLWARGLEEHYENKFKGHEDSLAVRKQAIRARVCDDLRGLLPSSTVSNLGIFASGQALEYLLLRMRAHPLQEVRNYSDLILDELKKVLPDFVRRVEIPDRGGVWSCYLRSTTDAVRSLASELCCEEPLGRDSVSLVDWDPEGELKIIAGALYGLTNLPDDQLLSVVRQMSPEARESIFWAYIGDRVNRRHKPGRAMERTYYRFDIVADYGVFRDLQRHRMLTLEWQRLTPDLGYVTPEIIEEMGWLRRWDGAMARCAGVYSLVSKEMGSEVAQYVLPFAYKIRFYLQMNAREAFHFLELRSQKGGHVTYRRICMEMHRQIAEVAGHQTS